MKYLLFLSFALAAEKNVAYLTTSRSISLTESMVIRGEAGYIFNPTIASTAPTASIVEPAGSATFYSLLDSLERGDVEEFKESYYKAAPICKLPLYWKLPEYLARYGDEECARILLELPSYSKFDALKDAIEAGNYKTLSVIEESKEDLMRGLLDVIWTSDVFQYLRTRMVVGLLEMYPELASMATKSDILANCIAFEMSEEFIYLHQTFPNLKVNEAAERAFIEAAGMWSEPKSPMDFFYYLSRNVFNSQALLIEALSNAAVYRSFETTFNTLFKVGIETEVLTQHQTTKFSALLLDYAIMNNNRELKKLAMRHLMDPTLSLSERLHILSEEQVGPLTFSLLTIQLIAIRWASEMPPIEIFEFIAQFLYINLDC